MHRAGTFSNFRVKSISNPTGTLTITKNGTDTAITCSLSGNPATCSDTTNSVSFAAGDTVTVHVTSVAGAKPVVWTIEYH